jgi:hypothetical protein
VRRQNVSPWVYPYASAGMKTKKNMGNNMRSSPLSVTCNRSFAACLVKHHANDCNPEGISARRIACFGRLETGGLGEDRSRPGPCENVLIKAGHVLIQYLAVKITV